MNKERLEKIKENINFRTYVATVGRIGLTPSEKEVLELVQYIDELEQVKNQAIEYIEDILNSMWVDEREALKRVLNILRGEENEIR